MNRVKIMAKELNNELLKEISGGGYDGEGILRLDELTRRYKSHSSQYGL